MNRSNIIPGARVRLARGAVINTTNTTRDGLLVSRPYWITVAKVENGRVFWTGRAAFDYDVAIEAIDEMEDYRDA